MSNSPLLAQALNNPINVDRDDSPTEVEYLNDPSSKSDIMGMALSTAKVMVPLSWAYDFLAQQWAILIANPNMQVINDRNPGAFSPIPYAIGAWFFPQQIIELMYIREFFRPAGQIEKIVLDFAPFFVLGNFMIGTWPIPWNAERLKLADFFVIVNTIQSLYWVYFRRAKNPVTYQQKLTNAVAYSFAGIGVLDFLHNTSIGFFTRQPPNTLVKAATLIGFPLISYFSPVAMGLSFVYNQVAVAIGQADLANKAIGGMGGGGGADWAKMLGVSAAVTAGVVALKYRREGKIL